MLRDEVLALLKAQGGAPLSGEAMSQKLGVSRAAVWKAMEGLRQEGYVISSAPRRGYALEDSPDLLSPGELMDVTSTPSGIGSGSGDCSPASAVSFSYRSSKKPCSASAQT